METCSDRFLRPQRHWMLPEAFLTAPLAPAPSVRAVFGEALRLLQTVVNMPEGVALMGCSSSAWLDTCGKTLCGLSVMCAVHNKQQ